MCTYSCSDIKFFVNASKLNVFHKNPIEIEEIFLYKMVMEFITELKKTTYISFKIIKLKPTCDVIVCLISFLAFKT